MSVATPSSQFTRPADTTAYASGDLVANSTTPGSVVPLSWTVMEDNPGNLLVRRARIKKSTNTTANASFRLHLYETQPTVTNGDNGAWLSTDSSYLGAIDITVDKAFSDPSSRGIGVSNTGSEIIINGGNPKIIYGLLEARAAYAPGNAEVFTVYVETYMGDGDN